jgi:hypothetical protein
VRFEQVLYRLLNRVKLFAFVALRILPPIPEAERQDAVRLRVRDDYRLVHESSLSPEMSRTLSSMVLQRSRAFPDLLGSSTTLVNMGSTMGDYSSEHAANLRMTAVSLTNVGRELTANCVAAYFCPQWGDITVPTAGSFPSRRLVPLGPRGFPARQRAESTDSAGCRCRVVSVV